MFKFTLAGQFYNMFIYKQHADAIYLVNIIYFRRVMVSGYLWTVKSLCTMEWLLVQDTPQDTVYLLMQDLNYLMVNITLEYNTT